MGLSIVTAHAATVTGIVSSGNEYRYHEDKTPVPQWGPYTSNKLKYFTRNDTGETVPAYCMEPEVRSASGDLQYSSTSWSDLTWNQRYAVTLAMADGYGGKYGFKMHPDCAQLATQAVVWEFVCGYRSPVYPYALYDTTCANLFHYAGDDVAVAYNIIIDRIMNHGKIPSFAVKYRNQLSDANAITLTWDGSQYVGTATDTNGVLSQYAFRAGINGVTVKQRRNVLSVTATKDAAAQLNGYISSDYGYSLDVEGTESVLLEPSNGSNYQACAALTSLPDPVWAYIHFKVKIVEEKGSITVRKVDVTGSPLAGAELMLETSADGKTWSEVGRVTTDKTGIAKWSDLKTGAQYRVTETKSPAGYTLLTEPLFTGTLDSSNRDITITACNNAGFALPFTGSNGFIAPIMFAALMLCMGVYFCKKSNIKKETTK
ncbi:MAG: SpaA isopeptide-forming pilin-related protein [Vescimonas sp.]|uniref:SpaA isopeptide-forming pilin-related protein n=1 Tax=Vescimonas sp. TaxID=2892404 RepID=UPI002A90FD60|nr:SpaA isopeptide-forming pilin-related protein [Vescimonas sp.]MDY5333399.1 SpaA isopeptide-forming pilin-related protein [Vescimonas sp.]